MDQGSVHKYGMWGPDFSLQLVGFASAPETNPCRWRAECQQGMAWELVRRSQLGT